MSSELSGAVGARPRVALVVAVGAAIVAAAAFLSLALGIVRVPIGDVVAALRGGDGSLQATLVRELRLPRALGAIAVGAALGSAGCLLQALLRNPLASPTVIGTAQAAAFGKVVSVFLGFATAGALGCSFASACLAALLVLALARTRSGMPTLAVVLMGINLSLFFGALTALSISLHRDENQLGRMTLLLAGGLWQLAWGPLALRGPLALLASAAACFLARRLDLLALGEEDALRLGVDPARTGALVLLLACLLTALAVCLAGVVAFVGLVVPHAARRLVGPAHGALVPASALLGALLVLATDTLARTLVAPNELPLGVLTSLIGVPCFVLIVRSLRTKAGEA